MLPLGHADSTLTTLTPLTPLTGIGRAAGPLLAIWSNAFVHSTLPGAARRAVHARVRILARELPPMSLTGSPSFR